jgi:hypothetical protein
LLLLFFTSLAQLGMETLFSGKKALETKTFIAAEGPAISIYSFN